MVGIHEKGSESTVARISLVNYHGHVLLDTFVQPREKVTDYRTWVSGVRASDLEGAPVFDVVQKQVAELVEGRILVGHAIENDLKVGPIDRTLTRLTLLTSTRHFFSVIRIP
jgi:RNA exonuclease 4